VADFYVASFDLPGAVSLDELRNNQPEESEEDLEPDVKTTFAHFGLAYYHSSVLEHEIVNILSLNRIARARQDAEQLLSDPFDEKFKDTMGRLVKQLEDFTQADPGLASDLVKALQLRNDLAHRFWRERAEDFCSDEGRARMIDYLISARKHFQDVDRRLTETVGTATIQQAGLTAERVESWFKEETRRAEAGESNMPLWLLQEYRDDLLRRTSTTSA
jgi:hypothetical protein